MKQGSVATPFETIESLLESAGRLDGAVPLRWSFVQQGVKGSPEPGPLANLVRNRDRRGLDLYLMLKAVASSDPYTSHRGAAVWARALRHTGVTASEQTVSKIWRRLESLELVERGRHGRLADIRVLDESGSGSDYVHPAEAEDPYLQLSVAYWLDTDEHWCATLSLPAKAMLLVVLSLRPGSPLPGDKVPEWYGISADSAQRGLAELVKRGALQRRRVPKKAPLAPLGFTTDSHYTLLGDFTVDWQPRSG